MYKTVCLLVIIVVLASTNLGWAATVVLRWEANSEPDLEGYTLHYRTTPHGPYTETRSIDKDATTLRLDLSPETTSTYYFALTARDTSGNVSDYSTEVTATISVLPGKPGVPTLVLP